MHRGCLAEMTSTHTLQSAFGCILRTYRGLNSHSHHLQASWFVVSFQGPLLGDPAQQGDPTHRLTAGAMHPRKAMPAQHSGTTTKDILRPAMRDHQHLPPTR